MVGNRSLYQSCWGSVSLVGEGIRDRGAAAQAAVDVGGAAGPAADLAAGRPGNRAGLHQQDVAHGDPVADGDGRPDVVGDGLVVKLVRTRGALPDDHQLFGGVVGVVSQPGVRVVEHLFGQLVGKHREGGHVTGAQGPAGFLRRVLQILRIVVAAIDDDEILDPAGDVQLTVVVRAVVAGAYPCPVIGGSVGVRRV